MQENIIGGTITYKLTADPSELYEGLDSARSKVEGTADDFKKIETSANRSFGAAAEAALSFASNVSKAIGDALDTVNSLGTSIQNTFEKISGINLPSADMGYATNALSIGNEMAAKIEGASMGMTLMTKDASRTENIMNKVVQDATRTTFNVSNLLGYTQQIGAAAHGDYEEAERAALGFGGAMVAAGNGLRDMGLVVRNIQQGMARGYNSIDLRQFKTYIPQFTQIMEAAGLTDEKIIKMGTDGAKAVNQAIANWVEAENIWEKYEYTYTNLKESLNEALQTTAMEAYTESGLFDAIKNAMVTLKQNLPVIKEGLKGIASTIANIVNTIDWTAFVQGIAAGIQVIADMLGKAAKVVMDIIKWVGGGDVAKGIQRIIPFITGATIAVKALNKGFGLLGSFTNIFGGRGGLTTAIENFGGITGKVAGIKGAGGGKLGSLTQLAISLAAFAGALWLIQKALPGTGAEVAELAVKLGIMGTVIVSMELIAKLASKLRITKAQIRNLTMMAGELAVFAAAIWVVDKLVPSDIGNLSLKLAGIAEAIVGLSVIAGVLGIGVIDKSVKKGLVTVIGIAGTLVLAALALKAAYDVIPDDFGGMQVRIGSLALVIVEVGVLAGIIGALMSTGVIALFVVTGLVTIVAIAGALALAGAALKSAYDNLPDDFGGMQARIGGMALVVGEIAALSTALGIGQILSLGTMTLGLLTLVEISAALALAAKGIKAAADNMPENMDAAGEKIKAGTDFLMKMKEEYAGPGGLLPAIGSFFWNGDGTQNFDSMVAISRKLAEVAVNLSTLTERMPDGSKLNAVTESVRGAVKFLMDLKHEYAEPGGLLPTIGGFFWNGDNTKNFDVVNDIAKKLAELADNLQNLSSVSAGKLSRVVNGNLFPVLKQAMEVLKREFTEAGGLLPSIGRFVWNGNDTSAIENSTKIAETLGKLVDNLTKIQDVKPGKVLNAIQVTIPVLKQVSEKLHQEFTEEGGFFKSFGSFFSNGESTDTLNKSTEIAQTLGGLVENLSKIQTLEMDKLKLLASNNGDENPIIKLKDVVTKIKENFVDSADSVTNKLKEYDVTGLETAKKVADNIKGISDTLSGISNLKPDVAGIGTFIESMKQIVSKIVQQFGKDSDLIDFPEEVATGVSNVSKVVSDISQMNTDVNNLKPINSGEVNKRIDEIKAVIERIMQVFVSDGKGEAAISGLTDNFADDIISSSVDQVLKTVQGMKSIGNEVKDLPEVPADTNTKITKIKELIKEVVYTLDNSGEDAIDLSALSFIDISQVPGLIKTLKEVANESKDFPDAGNGSSNLKTFAKNLTEALKNLPTSTEIESLFLDLKTLGNDMVTNILEGFQNGITAHAQDFWTAADEIYMTLYENLVGGDEVQYWYEAGEAIVMDLANGILDSAWAGGLYDAGIELLDVLNNAIGAGLGNDAEGSGAPQTWFMIGQKIVSDIANGIFNADFEPLYLAGDQILLVLNNALGAGLGGEGGEGAPQTWYLIGQKIIIDLANGMLVNEDILDATGYQLYQTMVDTIIADGAWGEIGIDIVRDMANGMLDAEEMLYTTIEQLVFTTFDILIADGAWYEIGTDIASNIAMGITTQQAAIVTQVQTIFQEIVRNLDRPTVYNALGQKVPNAVAAGMNSMMNLVRRAMSTLNDIISHFSTGAAYSAGQAIVEGLARGITWNMWRINIAMGNLSSAAINTLRNLLDIHSPSRVMFRLGEYTGEGLARGLLSTENSVSKAALRTGRSIFETAYFSYKNVGVNAGQGLIDGLDSMSAKVAEAAKRLASTINTEMETINPVTYVDGTSGSESSAGTTNKTNNITLNNNIYNELDLSAAMAELKWEMAKQG